MKRAVGVVRVSATKGREGESFHSPETQLQRIKDACERDGLELVAHYEELDVSGRRPLERRPGLSRAVAAIEAGRADVIVVAYFDRLVRSIKTQAEVADRVERAGGDILTLDAGQITNGTAATRLQANLLGSIAQYVADQTGEKVREAQAHSVMLGIPPFPTIPPGYVRGPDKRLVVDPVLGPVVTELFSMRARGVPINACRTFLLEHGVKRTYGGVAHMLHRRTYLGEIVFGALRNEAAHEPLVDRLTFERVQNVSLPRDHAPIASTRLLARLGVLRCGQCGSRLVVKPGGTRHNVDGRMIQYPFYSCRAPDCTERVSISSTLVELLVVNRARELVADLSESASPTLDVEEQRIAHETAENDLKRAFELLTVAGLDVADPAAVARLGELRIARDEKRVAYERVLERDDVRLNVTGRDWDVLTLEEQRALIRAVIERVDVRRGRGHERVTILAKITID